MKRQSKVFSRGIIAFANQQFFNCFALCQIKKELVPYSAKIHGSNQ